MIDTHSLSASHRNKTVNTHSIYRLEQEIEDDEETKKIEEEKEQQKKIEKENDDSNKKPKLPPDNPFRRE
ncbi:MAG: hypothetical protein KF908_00730 [Nitrosomonas sp.]|nr:hypothetical protein [Nitrosomonas sp.]MCW5606562.1 hypothetical protein [Nitrosomonas sp.]